MGAGSLAPCVAAVLLVAWLLVDPRTPDLAAQVYRVGLFDGSGLALWDEHWYAGHHLPGYSLLFPPLAALLGVRLLGVLCALASTLLLQRLLAPAYGSRAHAAAALFAVAAVGDVWIGRLAFALGVAIALAAALAHEHDRRLPAALLALAATAASPVAGALLGLAALTLSLERRSARPLLWLAGPAALVVLALALLFPEGGWEPYPLRSFAATAVAIAAFAAGLAPGAAGAPLRRAAGIYLLACLACLLVHSPLGSNIERYGVLLGGPLLLCAPRWGRDGPHLGGGRAGRRVQSAGGAVAALVIVVWVVWGPVRETAAVAGSASTRASYYAPVERFLGSAAGTAPVRVEVPLTRSHWEAALLAPRVSLARGWEKQLDERYDRVLLAGDLTARSYLAWLRGQAVAYVALPDAPLDPSSAAEGRLIAGGLPYLRLAGIAAHWRFYRVLGATPLLSGAATLTSLGHDGFALAAQRAGASLVRVRYSRYLTVVSGRGCVAPAPGGWTLVRARAPGPLTVAARFSLARALGDAGSCTAAG